MKLILLGIFIFSISAINAQNEVKGLSVDTVFHLNKKLNGTIDTHHLESEILNETRAISIYRPPNYSPARSYGLFVIMDGDCANLAGAVETLIESKQIEPIIIVGIHLREAEMSDSKEVISMADFRNFEYLKAFQNLESKYEGTSEWEIMQNRYNRFTDFIKNEVIPFTKSTNNITSDHTKWTIGGYSNGGSFVLSFSAENPNIFMNIIGMSPGFNELDSGCELPENSKSFYYLCGGTDEKPYLESTQLMLPRLKNKNIAYVHHTYNSGHNWQMWHTFYRYSLLEIYGWK